MTKEMQLHQQRVIDEKTELDDKNTKLIQFLDTSLFTDLQVDEQERMKRQSQIMTEYSVVLGERIAAF